MQSFQRYVIGLRKKHSYLLDQIGNADETPVFLDMPTPVTVPKKVCYCEVNWEWKELRHCRVGMPGRQDKVAPICNLKRQNSTKGDNASWPCCTCPGKGLDGEWIFGRLAESGVGNMAWGSQKKEKHARYGCLRGHLTDAVKTQVRKMSGDLVIIPGGMTSPPQVLDVVVNKPFKDNLRKRYTERLLSGDHALTPSGKIQKPAARRLCEWILQACDEVTPESIISGFKKCCISNALDGNEDDVLWEEMGLQNESGSDRGRFWVKASCRLKIRHFMSISSISLHPSCSVARLLNETCVVVFFAPVKFSIV